MLDLNHEAHQQNYPKSSLYIVATPIGNIADFTYRALVVLEKMDYIICEDTRHSGILLAKLGLGVKKKLLSFHQYSDQTAVESIVKHLEQGARLAYISDAGTPAISDPGAKLVQVAQLKGFQTIPIGGISAVTSLLSVAGEGFSQYYFAGFLPNKSKAFEEALLNYKKINQKTNSAIVLYEASHRIYDSLAVILQHFNQHQIVIGREISKQFESIITLYANQSHEEKEAILKTIPAKGEFCIAISKVLKQPAELLNSSNINISAEEKWLELATAHPKISQFFQEYLEKLGAKTCTNLILEYFAEEYLTHPHTLKALQKKDIYDWALYLKNDLSNRE